MFRNQPEPPFFAGNNFMGALVMAQKILN